MALKHTQYTENKTINQRTIKTDMRYRNLGFSSLCTIIWCSETKYLSLMVQSFFYYFYSKIYNMYLEKPTETKKPTPKLIQF